MRSLKLSGLIRRNPGRPSLKQRAVALKATAGRVIKRPQVDRFPVEACPEGFVPYPFEAPASFTNISCMIPAEAERLLRIARADFKRRTDDLDRLGDERAAEVRAAIRWDLRLDELTALAARRTGGWPGKRETTGASPDAELLELGRRFDIVHAEWMAALPAQAEAHQRVETFSAELEEKPGWTTMKIHEAAWSQPGVMEAENAELAATGRMESITDMIRAMPAHTIEGLAVKARAVIPGVFSRGQYETDAGLGDSEDWTEKNARNLIAACLAGAGVDWRGEPVEAKPAAPVVLGGVTGKPEEVSQELRDAVEAHRAAVHALIGAGNLNDRRRVELENEVCRKLFRVQETPSNTLADLRWKTIYLWPHDLRNEKIALHDASSLDAIRDDLIHLAQRGSAAIEPHRPRPSEFDLSKCDLAKLARLYETVTSIWRHVGAETQSPCFWDGKRENFNPAGRVLDAEADRLAALLSEIEREAKLRTPQNDRDRDERLNVLALHELYCNGRFHDRALMAGIAEAWGA